MLLKARDLDSDAVLQADLCIVGAGAAGISIARALRGRGLDIVLLEGGGFEPSARSQELYKAEMKTVYRGRRKDGGYPMTSRLRYFGGTTNHWRGWCRPLEGFDFEARDWIPHSGWPIDLQDLQPWYEQALDLVQIEPFEDDHGASRREGKRSPRLVDSERLVTRIFHYSPPTRFGTVYRQDLVGADRVRLLLESNVLELRSDASGQRVESVLVQAEDAGRFEVRARAFVLAAGGIENPRLLLLSDSVQPGGLGNDRDQVGRYFMDHPHIGQGGRAVFRDPQDRSNFLRLYLKREKDRSVDNKTLGVWCLSEAAQRQERLQNFSMSIRNLDMDKLGELGRAVLETSATLRSLAEGETGAGGRSFYCRFSLRGEHGPNPDSRVTLSDERDRLGLRRAVLDWRLAERDARSMRRSVEVFCEEVAGSMLGRCRIQLDPEEPWSGMAGGDHHIGTTRMSADPATGVVDADCRVHGVSNLWVAGSSVFATCGMSNPTLTIVALALRLAGTLERELSP